MATIKTKNTKEKSLNIKDKLEVLRKVINTQMCYNCDTIIDDIEKEVKKLEEKTKCK